MPNEWSKQHARSVRVCAVPAMHLPNSGAHTLWRFPCAFIHSLLLFTGEKERASACLLSVCVSMVIAFQKCV